MILVTGATGNVGRELVRQLLAQGELARVLVRDIRKGAELGPAVDRAVGDLDEPASLLPAMKGIDRLYLVTPVTRQVAGLVAAARASGVRHVVKQSTIEADRSLGPGKWHQEQEKLIADSGIEWTFLRPTMLMVNTVDWWASTVKNQAAVYFPGGRGKVAPVDPRDVASVARSVLCQPGHAGRVYELTGPQVLTIDEMVRTLAKVLGKPIRYISVPAITARIWMLRSGLPPEVVNGLMETLGALRRNEYACVSDAVERVGGSLARTFEQWCSEHQADFR